MTDYSQRGEQRVILDLFSDKDDGRVLDIGAFNGTDFSNSRALIEKGWSGVLIEPSPIPFNDMCELYKDNDRVKLVHALVSDVWAMRPLWPSDDAVSTTDPKHYKKWKDRAKFGRSVLMPAVPVGSLHGPFDFITLDCEGEDTLMIFRALARENFKDASVLCVEYDSHLAEILDTSQRYGFQRKLRTSENIIVAR